jgi:CheY-like chemotaxis protein
MSCHRPTILLAEDTEVLAQMFTDLLTEEGYVVEWVEDGAAALRRLSAAPERYALVILDLMLPRVDGYLFRERQRADPAIAHIPVIAVSASMVVKYRGLPQELAPDHFLDQPVDLTAFFALVERYCGPPPG